MLKGSERLALLAEVGPRAASQCPLSTHIGHFPIQRPSTDVVAHGVTPRAFPCQRLRANPAYWRQNREKALSQYCPRIG